MFSKQCKLVIKCLISKTSAAESHEINNELNNHQLYCTQRVLTHLCLTSSIKAIFIYSFYKKLICMFHESQAQFLFLSMYLLATYGICNEFPKTLDKNGSKTYANKNYKHVDYKRSEVIVYESGFALL